MVVGRSDLVEDRSGVVVGGLLFLRPPLETAGPLEGESRREVASRCSKGGRRSWAHRKETPLAIGISGRRGLAFSEKNADEGMVLFRILPKLRLSGGRGGYSMEEGIK